MPRERPQPLFGAWVLLDRDGDLPRSPDSEDASGGIEYMSGLVRVSSTSSDSANDVVG